MRAHFVAPATTPATTPRSFNALTRVAWVTLVLLVLTVLGGCTSPAREKAAPARLALVIGNAAYENARPLNNPVHDAQDMCAALRGLGFVALCRTDITTRAEFVSLVDEYVSRLGPATVGVVYYAGHGVQVAGANFLVPTRGQPAGATPNPVAALYGIDDLFERLRERQARLNIVMLDACRTELFDDAARPAASRGAAAPAAARATAPAAARATAPATALAAAAASKTPTSKAPVSRLMRELESIPQAGTGLAAVRDAPPRTVVFYATASKSAAFDGDGRNGPLTKHILKHIGARGQLLESFFKRVTEGVETDTLREFAKRQSPFTYGSFAGQFCFAGCPGEGGEVIPIN